MPKMDISGIDEFSDFLSTLSVHTEDVLKAGVYDGADIVADAVRNSIQELPVDHGKATENRKLSGINEIQKQGLLDGFGISKMENQNGFINVKIGFSGYNEIKTKRFPNGQPNVLIARSLESGSSVVQKRPFVRPTLNKVKNSAIEKVQETITQEINKLERK